MPEHTRESDDSTDFDLRIRVPGVAYDIGQPGFPRVLVVQKIADTLTEYDDRRPEGDTPHRGYAKNALVRPRDDDTVYQCVYLPDGPVAKGDLNDPNTRYPLSESRLVPVRAERADPIDDSETWSPRQAVAVDVLESLFITIRAFADAPPMDMLTLLARESGWGDEAAAARASVEAADFSNVPNDEQTLPEYTDLDHKSVEVDHPEADDGGVDDGDGPEFELTDAEGDDAADEDDGLDDFEDYDADE